MTDGQGIMDFLREQAGWAGDPQELSLVAWLPYSTRETHESHQQSQLLKKVVAAL